MHRTSSRAEHVRKAVQLWLEPNYGSGSIATGKHVWEVIHTQRCAGGVLGVLAVCWRCAGFVGGVLGELAVC